MKTTTESSAIRDMSNFVSFKLRVGRLSVVARLGNMEERCAAAMLGMCFYQRIQKETGGSSTLV
jgi:hypothetical protein